MAESKKRRNGKGLGCAQMVFLKTPYLQLPETDGITIMWETDAPCASQAFVWDAFCPECGDVRYSPQGEPRIFTGNGGHMHKVRVSGLDSGKDYCCQAVSAAIDGAGGSGSGNGSDCDCDSALASEHFVFRTQPEKGGAFSFAVTSETGGSGSPAQIIEPLVRAIAAERPDFLLFVGDMVGDGRRKKDWDDFLFAPFSSLICHTPFYHCAGNHEERAGYMKDFLATSENGYYEFSYGCAHFVALDSTRLAEHVEDGEGRLSIKCAPGISGDSPQIKFLSDSLERSQAKWKFVYLHYPPYFSGTWEAKALRPLLCGIFERHGVDIVFSSHAIVYERSHPILNGAVDFSGGVRYIVVGGAGERPDWFHHKKAWHTAKSRAIPHFVHVSATPEQLELQAIDLNGRLFDTVAIQKGPHLR
jgi:hypothetical protein